jgi:hypothetical protein
VGPGNVGGRMIVNQPAKEKAGNGADSDNGDDCADWCPSIVICYRRHLLESIKHAFSFFARNERQNRKSHAKTQIRKGTEKCLTAREGGQRTGLTPGAGRPRRSSSERPTMSWFRQASRKRSRDALSWNLTGAGNAPVIFAGILGRIDIDDLRAVDNQLPPARMPLRSD